jgi:hypothetical protein
MAGASPTEAAGSPPPGAVAATQALYGEKISVHERFPNLRSKGSRHQGILQWALARFL